MIVSALHILIGMTIFFQCELNRFYIALVYFLSVFVHDLFFSSTTGIVYYGSAAMFDLLAIIIISNIQPISKTTIAITNICFLSIVLNLIGWLIWFLYWPPLPYNAAFIILYASAFIALIRQDLGPDGDRPMLFERWNHHFYYHIVTRVLHINQRDG